MSQTFWCSTCGCSVPWEYGAADNWPNLCDECVAEKIRTRLDSDAEAHQYKDMKKPNAVTLRVATADMGTREITFVGKHAERQAKFYTDLWARSGHVVTRI